MYRRISTPTHTGITEHNTFASKDVQTKNTSEHDAISGGQASAGRTLTKRLYTIPQSPFLVVAFLIAWMTCSTHADERGPGYVIFKTNKAAADSTAQIREVRKLETFPSLSRLHTTAGARIELTSAAFCAYIPDAQTAPDPVANLALVQEYQRRFPHLEPKLAEILEVSQKQVGRPGSAQSEKAFDRNVRIALVDARIFEGKDISILSAASDSLSVADSSSIHTINFEQIDLAQSRLPAPIPAKVAAFNNPHILFKRSQELLQTGDSKDAERAVALLEKSAQSDNRRAQFMLGDLYRKGEVVPANSELARQWIEKAAANGLPEAITAMRDFATTPEEAFAYLNKAASSGDADAKLEVALAYVNGTGVEKDSEKGKALLLQLAEGGNVKAMLEASSLFRGKDGATSLAWAEKAAKAGNAEAMFVAGMLLHYGFDVNHDYAKALEYYVAAGNLGHQDAMYEAGLIYLYDYDGVPLNLDEGIQWLTKAAEAGYVDAQSFLGDFYANRRNLKPNPAWEQKKNRALATKWYRKAASSGDPHEQLWFAQFLMREPIETVKVKEIRELLEASADKGLPDSAILLGMLYDDGAPGFPMNVERARTWYSQAVSLAEESSEENQESIRDKAAERLERLDDPFYLVRKLPPPFSLPDEVFASVMRGDKSAEDELAMTICAVLTDRKVLADIPEPVKAAAYAIMIQLFEKSANAGDPSAKRMLRALRNDGLYTGDAKVDQ